MHVCGCAIGEEVLTDVYIWDDEPHFHHAECWTYVLLSPLYISCKQQNATSTVYLASILSLYRQARGSSPQQSQHPLHGDPRGWGL